MLRTLAAVLVCLALLTAPMAFAGSAAATVVSGTLTTPKGEIVKFKALEGSMVTLANEDEGYRLGFTPEVLDAKAKKVRFTVVEITEPSPGTTSTREIDQIEVAVGAPAKTKAGATVSVNVTDIEVK